MGFEPRLQQIQYQSRNTDKEISKMDAEYYEEARQRQLVAEFNAPNMGNIELMNKISKCDPAYAKHMLEKNDLLKAFAYKVGGGVNMLEQPVCGRCEGVGTWGSIDRQILQGEKLGYCDACGHTTKNPITVQQYLDEYVNKIDKMTLDAVRPKLNELIELIEKGETE